MEWEVFKTFDDRANAELVADHLTQNGVPARIDYGSLESGVDGIRLYVSSQLAHRARWLLSESEFTDSELEYLATGKLPGSRK